MLIKICIDIWRDVFDWLSPAADRRQLAQKLKEIGDREFSDLCQKWLHEWSNVRIDRLHFFKSRDRKPARLQLNYDDVPFAETDLPDNIQDFDEILISCLDTSVLHFLSRLQPIYRKVNLDVSYDNVNFDYYLSTNFTYMNISLERAHTVLRHLLPIASGIESVHMSNDQLLFVIRDHFPEQFFAIKRIELEWLHNWTDFTELMDLLLPWLTTRLPDGEPRMLMMQSIDTLNFELSVRIRQHFLEATSPVSFFIRLRYGTWEFDSPLTSITQNSVTNEQLMVRKIIPTNEGGGSDTLLIGRCPTTVLDIQAWAEQMDTKLDESRWEKKRRVIIDGQVMSRIEEKDQPGPSINGWN